MHKKFEIGWLIRLLIVSSLTTQLKELQERKKQQLRQKALKLGLNPEALTGKYPVSRHLQLFFYAATKVCICKLNGFVYFYESPKSVLHPNLNDVLIPVPTKKGNHSLRVVTPRSTKKSMTSCGKRGWKNMMEDKRVSWPGILWEMYCLLFIVPKC